MSNMEKLGGKKTVWEKIKKGGEVAAFIALFASLGVEGVSAQEKKEPTDVKSKIERLKLQTEKEEKAVEAIVEQKGVVGKYGEEPVKRLETPEGRVVVGYDKSGKKPLWIFFETPDAVQRYADLNNDGSVERVIINKNEEGSAEAKSSFNDLSMFQEVGAMAEEADVTAGLRPEHKLVFIFSRDGDGLKVQSVDFRNGEKAEVTGEEAEKYTQEVQASYLENLKDLTPEK